ncbi:TVP38/TMEM64 family protein [Nesterenkonia flava]|uniref:TVP38/TMEM64 family membrane protein n=1 Tax=Nesterenkonia flava TaxID=469799 RepID=A0ABU1FT14_9MICC|nr:VTT domain-containing protein [Nesterenkonia flava]MDR5711801.1 VTT domain-containing protein [Nesterenkonia flava]
MTSHENSAPQPPASEQERWVSVLQNVTLGIVVLGLVWITFNVQLPSVRELQSAIDGLGWGGWLAFIALYALVAITPVPVTMMPVTGGFLFGLVGGTVLSVTGVLLGCWIAYWGARGLGKQTMRKLLGRHGPTVEEHVQESGFYAVATLRLMPGLPYWPVNYGSGAFGVKHGPYVLASAVSCLPGQFSLVAVGAFIAEPSVVTGVAVAIGWAAVVVLTVLAYRRWKRAQAASSAG